MNVQAVSFHFLNEEIITCRIRYNRIITLYKPLNLNLNHNYLSQLLVS